MPARSDLGQRSRVQGPIALASDSKRNETKTHLVATGDSSMAANILEDHDVAYEVAMNR